MTLHRTISPFLILLSIFLFTHCSKEKQPISISGNILNLNKDYIILSKVEDIHTKKSIPIDSIYVHENGTFSYKEKLETAGASVNIK